MQCVAGCRESTFLQEHCAAACATFTGITQLDVDHACAVQAVVASCSRALQGLDVNEFPRQPPPDVLLPEGQLAQHGRVEKKVLALDNMCP